MSSRNRILAIAALALVAVMVLPIATPVLAVGAASAPERTARPEAKIAPDLLNGKAYGSFTGKTELDEALNTMLESAPARILGGPGKLARVAIYYVGGSGALAKIKEKTYRVTALLETGRLNIAFALATREQVKELAGLPFVVRIEAQRSLLDEIQPMAPSRLARAAGQPATAPQQAPPAGGGQGSFPIYSAPDLLGAKYVWEHYNITGHGVKIAIVDTGVDLGSPDLGSSKVARDANGVPLVFDADELGLVLLFPAEKINSTAIKVTPVVKGLIPFFFDGTLYGTDTAFAEAFNLITGNLSYYEIPIVNVTYRLPSVKGNVTFGLAFQIYRVSYLGKGIPFYGVIAFTAPTALADTDGDGYFDTAYVDLSTTYYLVMKVLNNATGGLIPQSPEDLEDYSFADEPALTYSGNVVANRDFTGDGVPDFSVGTLAGALYDYWGVFGPSNPYGLDWRSDWEPTAYVMPGMDTRGGAWLDLLYDFHGHGTSCAHVAAASGETERILWSTAPGVSFKTTMPGMAPDASVGAAVALWNGDVVTAELWLAGFDLVNPDNYTWKYTGSHQADVISNSWGSSWLLWNGYASDADPTSLWEDLITAVSGTVIVHAAGNGGPGFGSVTYPGAAAFVITVGAATDFYYRPVYGVGNSTYLPGGYGLVVSWSDRGPTELGYPKPDVLAIGSFEWAGDRAIDAPFNGAYAYELFGGTSEATPMTAGAAALVIEALREAGIKPVPLLVKAILKSTASDMGFDPFSQGSGLINVSRAVEAVLEGGYVVLSYDSALNMLREIDETMAAMLNVTQEDIWDMIGGLVGDAAVYPGPMVPGESRNLSLRIVSLSGGPVSAKLDDYTYMAKDDISLAELLDVAKARLVGATDNGSVVSINASSLFTVGSDGRVYLNISALPPGSRIAVPLTQAAERMILHSNMTVISLGFPASFYFAQQPDGRPNPIANMIDAIWELVVWFDLNGDNVIDAYKTTNGYYYETARLNYDYRVGPVYHLEVADPLAAIVRAAEAASKYTGYSVDELLARAHIAIELRVFGNEWYGSNATLMPLNGGARTYAAMDCGMVSEPEEVSSNGPAVSVDVTVKVPAMAPPGIYEGYLVVRLGGQRILVPVSIPVAKVVDPAARPVYVLRAGPQGRLYDNYAFRSTLDQTWRPEVGDWRVYPLAVPSNTAFIASTMQVVVLWSDKTADYDAGLIGPGVNWWGVLNPSTAAYIDAAVLGAKLTVPYVVGGVYSYFDYPLPGMSSLVAPLDPLRGLATGEEYTYYWLVVHQKFAGKDGEAPLILLKFGEFLKPNIYSVKAGSKGYVTNIYSSHYYSEALLAAYIVINVSGSGLALQPSLESRGLLRLYNITYDATNAGEGIYILLTYIVEPGSYSVVAGYVNPFKGFPAGLDVEPYIPLIYYTVSIFRVTS